jgi:hypothetical protein
MSWSHPGRRDTSESTDITRKFFEADLTTTPNHEEIHPYSIARLNMHLRGGNAGDVPAHRASRSMRHVSPENELRGTLCGSEWIGCGVHHMTVRLAASRTAGSASASKRRSLYWYLHGRKGEVVRISGVALEYPRPFASNSYGPEAAVGSETGTGVRIKREFMIIDKWRWPDKRKSRKTETESGRFSLCKDLVTARYSKLAPDNECARSARLRPRCVWTTH